VLHAVGRVKGELGWHPANSEDPDGYAGTEAVRDDAGIALRSSPPALALRARRNRSDAGAPPWRAERVPFVALEREHALLAEELRAAFEGVTARSAFILGEEVERFEREFAAFCSVRHCVGVASGTAALTIALIAAGIGPGDEVIVPAHTFVASALAVAHAGAKVVFCDVEPDTGLIDVAAAAAVVGPDTAAIMPVHLYGQACRMDAISELARRHGLMVIEDAAQAHGATFRGRPAGGLGDAAAFSFYPSKNLGALGDGGAICTNDDSIAERARKLRNVGQQRKGEHVELGFNERLDGLQAAFLRVKLQHLGAGNDARRGHALRYRASLREEHLLVEREETPSVYHVFPILVANRDETVAALERAGVATGVHYARAASDHPLWRGRIKDDAPLDTARYWAAHELSLPMFPSLAEHEVERVLHVCSALGLTDPGSAA
jgi:dTDP-3-amino-3,4,6-trideoxy-alpha-D-glucose transaminase